MKSIRSFLFLSLISAGTCLGQVYVDGIAIDTLNAPFCQLICVNGGVMSKTSIQIDYGQRYVSTGFNRQKIAGPDNKPITFNSTIDALNFMVKQGWELVSSHVTGNSSGSERTFVYLLRRKTKAKGTD